jgi:UDP-N-acetylglucosamine--N-acetylmuramyl-(pentapeptide) pyrophosphoryl-undecaprenol N-acetylglucosamine transferase
VVSRSSVDASFVSSFPHTQIFSGKLRRYFSFKNFFDIFSFGIGVIQSFFIFLSFRPTVVFSKGGFVSVPIGLIAKLFRVPLIIHESDSVPGLANKILSRFASKICFSFPKDSYSKKEVFTGTPVRKQFFTPDAKKGKEFLGIKNDFPVLLFLGASQGSKTINDLAKYFLHHEKLPQVNIVVIRGNDASFQNLSSETVFVYDSLKEELPHVMACSDIIISRAGSNTLFELSAVKVPNILIPHPYTGGDHQRKNAKIFEKAGASFSVDQNDENFIPKVFSFSQEILSSPKKQESMKKALENFQKPDTLQIISEEILFHSL